MGGRRCNDGHTLLVALLERGGIPFGTHFRRLLSGGRLAGERVEREGERERSQGHKMKVLPTHLDAGDVPVEAGCVNGR